MLTVLAKYHKTKREVLLQANAVEYVPKGDDRCGAGLLLRGVNGADGANTHLGMTMKGDEDFRDVFVMNADGQTVARYII